jgi:DNA-binding NarL/FixJ family response regulator
VIRVLLADDHRVLRDGLRCLLETDSRIRVVAVANDGREAIARAAESRPDVIVMDVSMPNLGGIAATRSILASAPATGVVMLSMHSSGETIHWALDAGARGYLLKESASEEVVNAVRAVAAGGCYLGQGIEFKSLEPDGGLAGRLTTSERRVLRLVVEGMSNAQAAQMLDLSPRTVETYRARLMEKLQLDSLPGLVKFAIRNGITGVD